VYSKIQQQCLNELGIQAFELKPEFQSSASHELMSHNPDPQADVKSLSWQNTAKSFVDDLTILFSDITLSEQSATFMSGSSKIEWLQVENNQQPSIENNRLVTKTLSGLSVNDKRQVWQLLQTLYIEQNAL
jgi:hypothetical protein